MDRVVYEAQKEVDGVVEYLPESCLEIQLRQPYKNRNGKVEL